MAVSVEMTAFWNILIALMMGVICTSETSVYFDISTQHNIPDHTS
jgi:hypothetical protein